MTIKEGLDENVHSSDSVEISKDFYIADKKLPNNLINIAEDGSLIDSYDFGW